MHNTRYILLTAVLWLASIGHAMALPCDSTNQVVCDFLNRYLKELSQWQEPGVSLQQKMYDDKVIIFDGSLDNLSLINDNASFTLERIDNKAYYASWQDAQGPLLSIAFPIQYEQLLGISRKDLEPQLKDLILRSKSKVLNSKTQLATIELDSIAPGVYRNANAQHYYVASLTDATYYTLLPDGTPQLINDPAYPEYTLLNHILLGRENTILRFHQSLYDFSYLDYDITLARWLQYCHEENLHLFVGIEEETKEAYKVLMIALSQDLNYNHTLSLLIKKDYDRQTKLSIPTKVNAFIPTNNVRNLYKQYDTNKIKKQLPWETNK